VDPAQTTASGSGLSNSVAGVAGPVVIQTRDRHGNVLAADQTVLSVLLRSTSGGSNLTATVTAVAGMVGQYQTSLSPTVAGAYSVEVRYGGTLVGGAATGTPKIVSPGKQWAACYLLLNAHTDQQLLWTVGSSMKSFQRTCFLLRIYAFPSL
jgi:hypothetical protein